MENNKIELDCYMGEYIEFSYDRLLNKYYIEKPLQFIPYKLAYTEEEMKTLIEILYSNGGIVKITKEKVDD